MSIWKRGSARTIRCGRSAGRERGAGGLSGEFSALYARMGRPSIPPEKLLRAMLLQAFYSVRSERQLMERLEFNLLFRWFVGLALTMRCGITDVLQEPRSAAGGRHRRQALGAVLAQPRVKRLLSTDHFSVDGTLIEAWASMKSFRPKDGSGEPPRRAAGGTAKRTSTARSAPTRRTPRRPIRTRGSIARGRARRPSSASWAMC